MGKFFTGFLTALFGSIVANLIVLFVLKPFVINATMPLHALSVGPVIALTTIGIVGATIVYALLRAFTKSPNTIFTWIAIVVLIVSFIPDYLVIGVTTGPFAGGNLGSALTLALMHVATAVIVVLSLTKLWGARNKILMPAPAA
jgi:hypothetical protein